MIHEEKKNKIYSNNNKNKPFEDGNRVKEKLKARIALQ